MGGSAVSPALYGENPDPETGTPDEARDRLELALTRDVPLLAICREFRI
jgi:gamma-glutamyl-gamma-aminobutyrate hydrolase PuuD